MEKKIHLVHSRGIEIGVKKFKKSKRCPFWNVFVCYYGIVEKIERAQKALFLFVSNIIVGGWWWWE